MTAFCSQICIATNHVHSISGDSPREGNQQISKTSELQGLHTPQQPLDSPLEIQRPVPSDLQPAPEIQPTICSTKSALASSFHHQTAAQISISFHHQAEAPKSASASSFHHKAAAPNQHQLSVSTTRQQHHITQPPARHPTNQLLTLTSLPHPHHGSQVCCCLDIL